MSKEGFNPDVSSEQNLEAESPLQTESTPDKNTSSDNSDSIVAESVTTIDEFNIDNIERDEKLQVREHLDQATIDDYAEEMKAGAKFPPVEIFYDGTSYYLADGWHRFKAALSINATNIRANVRSGSRRDAVLHAAGSNSKHGLRRTRADKRKAVGLLLHDEECRGWSDRKLADQAGVDHKTVASVRKELVASGEIPQIEVATVDRGSQRFKMPRGKSKGSRAKVAQESGAHPTDRNGVVEIIGQPNSSTEDDQPEDHPAPHGDDQQNDDQPTSDEPTEANEKAETPLQEAPLECENTPDEAPEPDQPESANPTPEDISDCIVQAVMACLQPFHGASLTLIEEAYQQAWPTIKSRREQQNGSMMGTISTSDC
jgi:ParB-like chromosome segregation protein Spo0J